MMLNKRMSCKSLSNNDLTISIYIQYSFLSCIEHSCHVLFAMCQLHWSEDHQSKLYILSPLNDKKAVLFCTSMKRMIGAFTLDSSLFTFHIEAFWRCSGCFHPLLFFYGIFLGSSKDLKNLLGVEIHIFICHPFIIQ